ncbi:MAG: threonine-phosphate decarboxylase CobD [Candidatus Omnitrophota bacterium]
MNNIDRHGGNIWRIARRYGLRPNEILDFSANINPLGLSPRVKSAICDNLGSLISYPDPDCGILKNELSDRIGIDSRGLLIGNGSVELIYLIPRALAVRRAVVVIPAFCEYELAVKQSKAKVLFLRTNSKEKFRLNVEGLLKLMPKADLVFICNPNNPTGNIIPKEEILYLAKAARAYGVIIAVDEAFIDFVEDWQKFSVIEEAARSRNLLVLRSMTKFFALPGLRLGYLVGNKTLISKLSRRQLPWSVNCLAQSVGAEVIKDESYIKLSRELAARERAFLFKRLKSKKGISVYPPASNFILSKLTDKRLNSNALCDRLAAHGIYIRSCGNFRGLNSSYFRIAVRKRGENIKLLAALGEILESDASLREKCRGDPCGRPIAF